MAPMLIQRSGPITTIEDLKDHLQWAVEIEFATIPPYLCALYSLTDSSSLAYRTLKGVVMEEMLHMMNAVNMLNAVGGKAMLTGKHAPTYPGSLPHHAKGGPYIQLQRATPAVMRTVFMAIEEPEDSSHAPAESDEFQTIGQFYRAIQDGFFKCVDLFGQERVFTGNPELQRADTFVGRPQALFPIRNLRDVRRAITEIIQQGEGAPRSNLLPGASQYDPWGGKNHYGLRDDGTYGPILGTPYELSHYRQFQQLAQGTIPLPDTWPMQTNVRTDQLTGDIHQISKLFNACYSLMLQYLERGFSTPGTDAPFFAIALPLMHFSMPALAKLLMQTPLNEHSDPTVGPNAGPSFEYHKSSINGVINLCEELLKSKSPKRTADNATYVDARKDAVTTTHRLLEDARHRLEGLPEV